MRARLQLLLSGTFSVAPWAFLAGLGVVHAQTPSMPATASPATANSEVPVTLFGQPCLLSGPFPVSTLNAIHAVSPERVPPVLDLPAAQAAIEKLRPTGELPKELETYRIRLLERAESIREFLQELRSATRTGKNTALLAVAKKHVLPSRWTVTESRLVTLATPEALKAKSPAVRDELLNAYAEAIEQHPEEEFHRALQRLKTQYLCQFEDAESDAPATND